MIRLARVAATWCVLGFVGALLLSATVPLALGYHSFVLRTGSMRPSIDPGDVEVVEAISPFEAKVGQVVLFRDPQRQNKLVSHRVRSILRAGARIEFITQGDANTARENWSVPVDGTIGRVVYRVPRIGYAMAWLGTRGGRMVAVVLPALLLMASFLRRLWRPRHHPRVTHGLGT